MLQEQVIAPPNPVSQVFRRLNRQRSRAAALDTGRFEQTLANLSARRADALIEFYLSNGRLGHVLTQAGVAVYASLGDRVGLDALEELLSQPEGSQQLLYPLEPLLLALACAAVDGLPVTVPAFAAGGLSGYLDSQRLTGFSGLVAAERGRELSIWQYHAGQVRGGPSEIPDFSADRVTQFAWVSRLLPAVGGVAPGLAQSLTAQFGSAQPSSAQPSPAWRRPAQAWTAAYDLPDAWAVFTGVMTAHLGARAARVIYLTRQDHGQLQGDALNAQLLKQIERMGGKGAAQEFRQKMNL